MSGIRNFRFSTRWLQPGVLVYGPTPGLAIRNALAGKFRHADRENSDVGGVADVAGAIQAAVAAGSAAIKSPKPDEVVAPSGRGLSVGT